METNNPIETIFTKENIQLFIHCIDCIETLPDDLSPQENIYIEAGVMEYEDIAYMVVRCVRHDKTLGAFSLVNNPLEYASCDCGHDC